MPLAQWWQFRSFVDWRLRLKSADDDSTDFDTEGWDDFGG